MVTLSGVLALLLSLLQQGVTYAYNVAFEGGTECCSLTGLHSLCRRPD